MDTGRHRTWIATWLLGVAVMVVAMVILGGVTRLTDSGLSMVDWRPATGWLPPMSQAEWQTTFEAYQQFPEYTKHNIHMDIEGFKDIFWLEFIHRVWGRLIGVAFAVPFVFFLMKGWVDRKLAPKLAGLFVLGGMQGFMGWYMVKSGLIDRPDVSQYRLTAHLALALLILGGLLWVALDQLFGERPVTPSDVMRRLRRGAITVLALVSLTICAGGFVAGIGAGYAHNTYPLMDGMLFPDGLYGGLASIFEDITTVQFNHRHVAEVSVLFVLALWGASKKAGMRGRIALSMDVLAATVVMQAGLGIFTLVLAVPIWLAAVHQFGAVLVFAASVWTVFELRLSAVAVQENLAAA